MKLVARTPFDDYYDKHLKDIAKCAKRDKVTDKAFIKSAYHTTPAGYKKLVRQWYTRKDCHSFWHSECENRGSELCKKCCKFYSISDWDKMSPEERNNCQ